MNKTKHPGIAIEDVSLLESNLKFNGFSEAEEEEKSLLYHLQLIHFQRIVPEEEKSKLLVICSFDLMHDVESPVFDLTCTFCARYACVEEEKNMEWNDFSDVMTMAHIVPFVREFVSNMTNRLPCPPLMFSPVNVAVLLEEYHQRLETEDQGK